MFEKFDVIVIGGGPGGYVAAIKAAQLGLKTACIDKSEVLGGTCLNVGCIPSKALLNISEKYYELGHEFKDLGILCEHIKLDIKQVLKKKKHIVDTLTQGIKFLFRKNKVTFIHGEATFEGLHTVNVRAQKEDKKYEADHIIIATGSASASLPNITIDEKKILTSTGALELQEVPKTMVVVGGGYIGLELGSVWSRFGSHVHVIEYAERIVPMVDQEVGKALQHFLEKQGLEFHLATKVEHVKQRSKKLEVGLLQNKKTSILQADVVLIATGRKPYTNNLGLENIGISTDISGCIPVNAQWQTEHKHIYAIGDVISGPMLAHKAEEEGVAVAEIIAGQSGHVNYGAIPSVIYTMPEVASVGANEEELTQKKVPYKAGKFPFSANSRARAVSNSEGFVKILAHKHTDKILGAHIIGPDAGTLIAELVLAMEYQASSEDIARICHAHPTLNEAIKEAALSTYFKAIHQ